MIDLKPYAPLLKIAAVVALVVAAIWWWNSHNAGQQQIGYDRAMAEVAAEQGRIAKAKRLQEIEDQKKADKEAKDAQDQINNLERERDAARADAGRMRGLYLEAAKRGRQALACAAGASEGEPGSDPIGVFAELLIRADERAEAVAGYADRLRIAGESCERIYDEVASREGLTE